MLQDIYIHGDYLQKNPLWHVPESAWKAEQVLCMLEKHHLVPHTICEAGCGAGEILKLLQQRMDDTCIFQGYDISPQAIEMCKSRTNEKLQCKLSDITQEQGAFFDLMLIMDVLEHLEDYFSFLRAIHPKSKYKLVHIPLDLSVRTVLAGKLPEYRQTFGHLHYFTKETALQMLKDAGYEVLDYMYTFDPLEPSPMQIQKKALVRRMIGQARRRMIRMRRRVLFAIHADMAQRLLGECRLLVLAQ